MSVSDPDPKHDLEPESGHDSERHSSARAPEQNPEENPEQSPQQNPEQNKERWRLAWHYANVSDAELEALAAESASLTDVALRALQAERTRRGLPSSQPGSQDKDSQDKDSGDKIAPSKDARTTGSSSKLATVRSFRDMPEALLAKSVLESAGIDCLLSDANIIRTDWLWSNLVGGVKLRVQEEDLEAASQLLDQNPIESFAVQGVGDFEQPRCPRCQSLDISFANLHKPAAAAGLFVGAPLAISDPIWTCNSCGNQWQEPEASDP